jgi:hypothetical protein
MKKLIAITLVAITASSCCSTSVEKNVEKTKSVNSIKIESLMSTVDHGLHKIQLNDSTTVLLYRGTESCTMIQLK